MKLKSLLNSILMITLLLGGVLFFTGCEKDFDKKSESINHQIISQEVKDDAIQYYGRLITIKHFPEDKIWKESDSKKYQHLGTTKSNALVPLVFDENGVLYTAKRYNQEIALGIQNNEDVVNIIYMTDLKTFRDVSSLKEASEQYVHPLPSENGENVWMFDPYVKFFETIDEVSRNTNLRLQSFSRNGGDVRSVPSWAKLGNIIFAKWDGGGISDIYGHTGGVVLEPNGSGSNNFLLTLMKTVEASNQGKSIAGVTIGTQNGVFERFMSTTGSNFWASSAVYQRNALWYNGMSSTQRTNVKNYMQAQIGEPYNLSSSKTNTSSWYCSKLQWKAYSVHLGIDVDYNGGFTVFPLDIVNSSLLVGMSF